MEKSNLTAYMGHGIRDKGYSILKIPLILAILIQTISAQSLPPISVLEIIIPDATDENTEEAELTMQETKFLTDELRRQAAVVLEKEYTVPTREQILSMLPESEEEMEKLTNAVEIGKFFKSPFATNSFIGKLSNLFTLKVELYDTETGNLIGDFTGESQDLKGLMDVIRSNAPALFKKIAKEEEKEEVKAPEPVKVTVEVQTVPTNIPVEPRTKTSTWVAVGLDIFGAAALGFGIYKHIKAEDYYDAYKNLPVEDYYGSESDYKAAHKKAKDAQTLRNISFAVGGGLLAAGIAVHIAF